MTEKTGEPFANPALGLFVYEVKRYFPYADIRIVSNGLLLPRASDKTMAAIWECGGVIDISQYPPTRCMIEEIIQAALEKRVKIEIGKQITNFLKVSAPHIREIPKGFFGNVVAEGAIF